jgi:hypothetical protein
MRPAVRSLVFATMVAACTKPLGLTRSQIETVVNAHGDELKTCWKAKGPHGELKVHVAITMDPDGHVESAEPDGKDAKVNDCLEKQIKTWSFPKAEIATKFSLPVNFKR